MQGMQNFHYFFHFDVDISLDSRVCKAVETQKMANCTAKLCGTCGNIHNIEDSCPVEALWRDLNHKTLTIPAGNGYVLEVTPDLEVNPLPSPQGDLKDPYANRIFEEPIREVKLPEELENGLWRGWMEMEAYYEGLKG